MDGCLVSVSCTNVLLVGEPPNDVSLLLPWARLLSTGMLLLLGMRPPAHSCHREGAERSEADDVIPSPLVSLRGAKRRNNPNPTRWPTDLLELGIATVPSLCSGTSQ